MKLITRNYRPDDFEQLDAIWNATGMGGAIRGDTSEVILSTLKQGGKLILLADQESGDLIGSSWLTQDGRRIYLHYFGIKPEFQGRGYSKILLEASMEFARKTGLQIKLEVHQDNEIARDLYLRAGFKYLGDYDVYIIRNYETL